MIRALYTYLSVRYRFFCQRKKKYAKSSAIKQQFKF